MARLPFNMASDAPASASLVVARMTTSSALPESLTLGILAGGRGARLGGVDKAWLERDGVPQVVRLASRFGPQAGAVLVSANRGRLRYGRAGLAVVVDREPDLGPIGGLDALADACATPWLLTLPVDLVDANDCLLPSLAAAGGQGAGGRGAYAEDEEGPQPLVALWPVAPLRIALREAIAAGEFAVQALQRRLGMARVHLSGVRFGNLNTPADLEAAGIVLPGPLS